MSGTEAVAARRRARAGVRSALGERRVGDSGGRTRARREPAHFELMTFLTVELQAETPVETLAAHTLPTSARYGSARSKRRYAV